MFVKSSGQRAQYLCNVKKYKLCSKSNSESKQISAALCHFKDETNNVMGQKNNIVQKNRA